MIEPLVTVLKVAFVGFYTLVDHFVTFKGRFYLEGAPAIRVSAPIPTFLCFFVFADRHLYVIIFVAGHAVVLGTLRVLPLLLLLLYFDTILNNIPRRMSNIWHKLPRIENPSQLSNPSLPPLEYITALILKKPVLTALHQYIMIFITPSFHNPLCYI